MLTYFLGNIKYKVKYKLKFEILKKIDQGKWKIPNFEELIMVQQVQNTSSSPKKDALSKNLYQK